MTEYMMEVTKDYLKALRKAESILQEAEHDMWQNDYPICGLYDLSLGIRKSLGQVGEELYQAMNKELEK